MGRDEAGTADNACNPAVACDAVGTATDRSGQPDHAPAEYNGRGLTSSRRGWLLTAATGAAGGVLAGAAAFPAPTAAETPLKVGNQP